MFRFLKKVLSPFSRISSHLGEKLKTLFQKKTVDAATLEEVEKLLYEADLGAELSADLTEKVEKHFRKQQPESTAVLEFLKTELLTLFPPSSPKSFSKPHVILVVGVNGSGKTTTIAKLAARFRKEGKTVLLAAGDTFRAAAVEQLSTWAERLGVEIIRSQPNADPSAVAFDALGAAAARGTDIVLIDTAGRLQTKTHLMEELVKVKRICEKKIPGAPHETLLVLDATLGQNSLDQAKIFHSFVPLTGIVLTKLDGSAKGGIAACIQHALKIPILWAGLGEQEDDLEPFDAESYLSALLS